MAAGPIAWGQLNPTILVPGEEAIICGISWIESTLVLVGERRDAANRGRDATALAPLLKSRAPRREVFQNSPRHAATARIRPGGMFQRLLLRFRGILCRCGYPPDRSGQPSRRVRAGRVSSRFAALAAALAAIRAYAARARTQRAGQEDRR
jgi:hypothetical protein